MRTDGRTRLVTQGGEHEHDRVIGVGEIASAMVEGLSTGTAATENGGGPETGLRFVLSPRNAERARHLADTIETAEVAESNQEVVDRSDLIVLAVLPRQAAGVLGALDIPAEKTLVSAVAGIPTGELSALLPRSGHCADHPAPAVRERKGVTAMFPPTAMSRPSSTSSADRSRPPTRRSSAPCQR